MNDAHISAQIETLQMALDRIFNDCDKMQIELGRLKAGMAPAARPAVEPWQTEDVLPWTEDVNDIDTSWVCKFCSELNYWDTDPYCINCGKVQPVTEGRPIKCVHRPFTVKAGGFVVECDKCGRHYSPFADAGFPQHVIDELDDEPLRLCDCGVDYVPYLPFPSLGVTFCPKCGRTIHPWMRELVGEDGD